MITTISHTLRKNQKLKLIRSIEDFCSEYENIEIKLYDDQDFHDRYILTQDKILIIGHGLKDIGKKESFIIEITEDISKDIISSLLIKFKERWDKSILPKDYLI